MAGALPSFGVIGRFFGRTVSEGAAFALGVATGPVLAPPVEDLRQRTWELHAIRKPAVQLLAEGVAQGQVDEGDARTWAKLQGYGDDAFNAMRAIADTGPGAGRAFELWRRGLIDDTGFRRALRREAIETEWIDALVGLKRVLISPDELANAVVQGHRSFDDALADAERQGYTQADFQTMVDNTGLPPGPETLLDWLRRGITDDAGVSQGIREGHTKVKYIDEYLKARWKLTAATTWASLWLKGWATEAEAKAGGAANGYDAAAMERLYQDRGRPATVRQAHIGFQRGGRLPGAASEEQTIRRSVEESNIRSEWFDILYSQRYTYPSAFVLRALTQAGTFTAAMTETILRESGWKPEWAKLAADDWASGGAAPATMKWAGRAESRLFTSAQNEYRDGAIDEAQARTILTDLRANVAEQDRVLAVWNTWRSILRTELTVAQVRKAYKKGEWTRDQAFQELIDRDYTAEDANVLLDTA